jgi:hypothetical protein
MAGQRWRYVCKKPADTPGLSPIQLRRNETTVGKGQEHSGGDPKVYPYCLHVLEMLDQTDRPSRSIYARAWTWAIP